MTTYTNEELGVKLEVEDDRSYKVISTAPSRESRLLGNERLNKWVFTTLEKHFGTILQG